MLRARLVLACAALALGPLACLGAAFDDAKALFDAKRYAEAAPAFEAVAAAPEDPRRAEAAAFAIRSWSNAGRQDMVASRYAGCMAAALATSFEGEVAYEYARSVYVNGRDVTSGTALLQGVAGAYPGNVFAASGALLQLATMQANEHKAPLAACIACEDLIQRYPASPFVDDALLLEARTGTPLGRLDVIESCRSRLQTIQAPAWMQQAAQFEVGEFHNKARGDRYAAMRGYRAVFETYPAKSNAAALARIRLADLVPRDSFRLAGRIYEQVLAEYPELPRKQQDWCICQRAICHYQEGQDEPAANLFRDLLARQPEAKLQACARLHLDGFANPDSTSALVMLYDRGLRMRVMDTGADQIFRDFQRVIAKAREPYFERYLSEASTSREDAGTMAYRLSFANFFCGRSREAFALAERILAEIRPAGNARCEALFMRAFLLGRASRWTEAIAAWREATEMDAPAEYLARSYLEYSRALYFGGDPLGSVLALEELQARFPARIESAEAAELVQQGLLRNPALRPLLEEKKPLLAAKWKDKPALVT